MKEKTKTPEFSIEDVVNNPVKRQQLEGFIEEIYEIRKEIKKHNQSIADIAGQANQDLGIPKKLLGRLVKEKLKPGQTEAEQHEIDEAKDVVDLVINRIQPAAKP